MSRSILAYNYDPGALAKLRAGLRPLGFSVLEGERCARGAAGPAGGEGTLAFVDLDAPGAADVVARLRAGAPGMVVIGTAARPRGRVLLDAARLRLDGVMSRPVDPVVVERLARRAAERPQAAGSCDGLDSAQVLAMYLRAGEDGVLVFWRDGAPEGADFGCFHVEGGQVIHAVAGRRVGADAAREILAWEGARVRWLPGRTGAPRTILGRHLGLFAPTEPARSPTRGGAGELAELLSVAFPHVVAKMAKIAAMPQVVGAFLLEHGEVTHGAATAGLDEGALRRAVEAAAATLGEITAATPLAEGEPAPSEIQATAAGIRIIVDRVGPPEAGVQAGVAVYQAASISKSLRRLIRQVDRAFARAVERARAARAGGPDRPA